MEHKLIDATIKTDEWGDEALVFDDGTDWDAVPSWWKDGTKVEIRVSRDYFDGPILLVREKK